MIYKIIAKLAFYPQNNYDVNAEIFYTGKEYIHMKKSIRIIAAMLVVAALAFGFLPGITAAAATPCTNVQTCNTSASCSNLQIGKLAASCSNLQAIKAAASCANAQTCKDIASCLNSQACKSAAGCTSLSQFNTADIAALYQNYLNLCGKTLASKTCSNTCS